MPAPTSLGSVSEGMIGTQLDLQSIQMNKVKLQEEQISLQKEKISLGQQVKMLSLMQNIKPPQEAGTPEGIADVLNEIAMIQMESGLPDAAAKTAGEASRIQEAASKVDYRTYRMQSDRFSKFVNALSVVPDTPEGFTQAIQQMIAEDPGVARDKKFMSVVQAGWSPGRVGLLRASALNAKEQAEVSYRKAAEAHAAAAAKVDEHRVALIDEQVKLTRAREVAVRKEGGVVVKASQLKSITQRAMVDYPGADPADIWVRSQPLAEEMVKMMRDQHLTESQAATRVYEKARSSGVFQGLRQAPAIKGAKAGSAIAVPAGAKIGDLKQNQWYLFDGVPGLVLGGKAYTEQDLAAMDKDEKEALGFDEDAAEQNAEDEALAQ